MNFYVSQCGPAIILSLYLYHINFSASFNERNIVLHLYFRNFCWRTLYWNGALINDEDISMILFALLVDGLFR